MATAPDDDRERRGSVVKYSTPRLDLNDIQGDLVSGMQKHAELFLFFKIADPARFKAVAREYLVGLLTHGRTVQLRERMVEARRRGGGSGGGHMPWLGMNLGFTKDGLTQLLGANRPRMDPAFERGADDPETIAALNDPPPSKWLRSFLSDRIDGLFLIAGPNKAFVTSYGHSLRGRLGTAIKTVYSEIGTVRPGREKRHEHFGFLDGISQPGIRGLTPVSRPSSAPEQGLPGQDLIWPGEFILGYPGQDPRDPVKPGPIAPLPAPWAKNGSYMVFRRLEQRVPEFRAFIAGQAARLGMYPELLAARMVGRWKSGAPLELAPLRDNPALGADAKRNNDFGYADDPFQRKCPYGAHIRKANPRDDVPGQRAEILTHRIIRASIPFGPEVEPGETTTRHSRGLMFVCYQTSIERQFEFIQRSYSNDPDFVGGKRRSEGGDVVRPGFDPIIGQAPGDGPREMDEPYPNYPAGNRRTALPMPNQFVVLTASAYFFMPSITALRTVLT
jgi:Dyp-type peroxidase family